MFLSSDPATKVPDRDESDCADGVEVQQLVNRKPSRREEASHNGGSTLTQADPNTMPSGWLEEEVHPGSPQIYPNKGLPTQHDQIQDIPEVSLQLQPVTRLSAFPQSERETLGLSETDEPAPPHLESLFDSTPTSQHEGDATHDATQPSDKTSCHSAFPPGPTALPPSNHYSWPSDNNHEVLLKDSNAAGDSVKPGAYDDREHEKRFQSKHLLQELQGGSTYEAQYSSRLPKHLGHSSLDIKPRQASSSATEKDCREHSSEYSQYGTEADLPLQEYRTENASPYEIHIPQFRDGAFHGALRQAQPDLSQEQHKYAQKQVRAMSDVDKQGGPPEVVEGLRSDHHHKCTCGCVGAGCSCHPLYCECRGCDHTEEAEQLTAEAERKWSSDHDHEHEHKQEHNRGAGGGDPKNCLCLPGLSSCYTNCDQHHTGHEQVPDGLAAGTSGKPCRCPSGECRCRSCPDSGEQRHGIESQSDHTSLEYRPDQTPAPAPGAPLSGLDRVLDGDLLTVGDGSFAVQRNLAWGVDGDSVRRFVAEVLQKKADMTQEEKNEALLKFYIRERGLQSVNRGGERDVESGDSQAASWTISRNQERLQAPVPPPPCSCSFSHGALCTCPRGSCRCGTNVSTAPLTPLKASRSTSSDLSNAATLGSPLPPLSVDTDGLVYGDRSSASDKSQTRNKGHVETMLSDFSGRDLYFSRAISQPRTQPPAASGHQPQSQPQPQTQTGWRSTSRPDTPRPAPESGSWASASTTTPYLYPVLQTPIRQSVETDLSPPQWQQQQQQQRESTPAYEDRSATPSPLSRDGADVDMPDASGRLAREIPGQQAEEMLGRQASLPPSMLHTHTHMQPHQHQGCSRSQSPDKSKSPIPPIPGTRSDRFTDQAISPLKQPKRADRRKSAVQGAKVAKRAATATATGVVSSNKAGLSKAKSRNVTMKLKVKATATATATTARQPTTSVARLVEDAKKMDQAAVATAAAAAAATTEGVVQHVEGGEGGDAETTTSTAAGKVTAAVEKINQEVQKQEKQIKQTQKQKDGTPVRRSQRANKGMRMSLD